MKKALAVLATLCILITGCNSGEKTNQKKTEAIIKLTPNKGSVKKIAMNDIFQKMEKKETFVVMVSQTYCGACLDFFLETDAYTKEIGLTLWDIILDDETTSVEENLALLNKNFGHFSSTPSIYYIENGKVKDSLLADSEPVNKKNYEIFLKRNNIIK